MKNIKTTLSLMIFLINLIITTSSCQSKHPSEKKEAMTENPSYPKSTGYDVPYLQANFWRISYNSAGPALSYRIVLPKAMKPTDLIPQQLKDIGLTLIGQYQVVEKDKSYMEVQVAYEKDSSKYPDLKTWFAAKLKNLKATAIEESPVTIGANKGYDVLFTRTLTNGEQFVNRSTMIKHGDDYIAVTAMTSKQDYEKNAKTIYHVLTNWDMQ